EAGPLGAHAERHVAGDGAAHEDQTRSHGGQRYSLLLWAADMPPDEKPLLERLRALVGVVNAGDVARDPVNAAMIRHWCDAMTDHNPVYTDPEAAAKSIHGGLVAPPAMLNAWTMPGLPGRRADDTSMSPMRALDAAGFTSVIATNSEHEYL